MASASLQPAWQYLQRTSEVASAKLQALSPDEQQQPIDARVDSGMYIAAPETT